MARSARKSNKTFSSSVYLLPGEEGLWSAGVYETSPALNAFKLCSEQDYPVSVFYRRYDLNGSSVYEQDFCKNKEELIDTLNWCGKCGNAVLEVWDFSLEKGNEPEIAKLFQDGFLKKMEHLAEEMAIASSGVSSDTTLPDQDYSKFSTEELVEIEKSAYADYYKLATTPCTNPSDKDLEPLEKATAKWEAIREELSIRKRSLDDQILSASSQVVEKCSAQGPGIKEPEPGI